jgi:3-oxoacid CoA-transferase subunit B
MSSKTRLSREQVAARAALELHDGDCVNLGFGIPNLVSDFVPPGISVFFHSENGILGMGPRAKPGEEDYDVVDAMKVPVTVVTGASFFDQGMAHLMARGGHLDVSMLGGLQVAENGDFANWKIPGSKGSGGIGGAMDIATGARRLIVCMEHTTKDGAHKLVRRCTYPLTALACVHRVVTDLAVVDVTPEGFRLREVAPGWTPEEVQQHTGAHLIVRGEVPVIALPERQFAT